MVLELGGFCLVFFWSLSWEVTKFGCLTLIGKDSL